jgi:hypothetical protein
MKATLIDGGQYLGNLHTLIGTSTDLRCGGWFGFGRQESCDGIARVLVSYPGFDLLCDAHWRELKAIRAFWNGADNGSLVARDMSGIWRRVGQNWGFNTDGYPPAPSPAQEKLESLFPPLNVWTMEPESVAAPNVYGPLGEAVLAHLERARWLEWPEIQRVGNVWDHGGIQCGEVRIRDERRVRLGIAGAVGPTGSDVSVRQAYLDGQAAVFRASGLTEAWFDYWPISSPLESAMASAGYAAAALAVGDVLAEDITELAMRPWQILARGYPLGYFGPRTQEVVSILDAIPLLTLEQCDRIVATWARPYIAELRRWRAGVRPHDDTWLAWNAPRPQFLGPVLAISRDVWAERHLVEAWNSAWMRGGVPDERRRHPFYGTWAQAAFKAIVMAEVLGDLLSQEVAADLSEGWAARDAAVSPDSIELIVEGWPSLSDGESWFGATPPALAGRGRRTPNG